MNLCMKPSHRRAQRGLSMLIVLMMLLAIAGLTIFSARYATMGESISRNQLDSERARQAAESALRDAERDLLLADGELPPGRLCDRTAVRPVVANFSAFTDACTAGQCDTPETAFVQSNWSTGTNPESWWPDAGAYTIRWNNAFASKPRGASASCTFNGGVPLGTFTGAPAIAGVARQPEYLIEIVNRASGRLTFFRITARGFGAQEQTQVVLQSYFQPFTVQ